MKRSYTLKHSKVEVYRVTHNPNHHNFLISPKLLNERNLKFVYECDGQTIEKILPVDSKIGSHLKYRKFYKIDDETLQAMYRGDVFIIDENVIFNYNVK